MSQAEELLNGIAETVVKHEHPVVDSDSYFIIDPDTRIMQNTSGDMNFIMQGDHESERYTFELMRYIEGHDMSLCNVVKVHYNNEGYSDVKDLYDLRINPDDNETVICSWLISRESTSIAGKLSFSLQYQCVADDGTVTYEFNTDEYSDVEVKPTRHNEEQAVSEYTDLIETWRAKLFGAGDSVIEDIGAASESEQTRIIAEGDIQVERAIEAGQEAQNALTAVKAIVAGNEAHTIYESDRKFGTAIVGKMSGKSMIAKDSSKNPFMGMKMFGKTIQKSTTGAQLLDVSRFKPINSSLVKVSISEDSNEISIESLGDNGTVILYAYYELAGLVDGETYTIGAEYISNNCLVNMDVRLEDGTRENVVNINKPFVYKTEKQYTLKLYLSQLNETVSKGTIKKYRNITLSKGSEALPWEPYTGGQPSPSVDYPQELESLGEWGNLFDVSMAQDNLYQNADTSTNNFDLSPNEKFWTTGKIPIQGGKPFTCSYKWISGVYFDKDGAIIRSVGSKITDIIPKDVAHVRLSFGKSNVAFGANVMLNYGTIALPYRPYTGQKEIESSVYTTNFLDTENINVGSNDSISVKDNGYTISVTGKAAYANSTIKIPSLLIGKKILFKFDSCIWGDNQLNNSTVAQLMYTSNDKKNYVALTNSQKGKSLTIPDDATEISVGIYTNNSGNPLTAPVTMTVTGLRICLYDANSAMEWCECNNQSLITSLSDGLPGIPLGTTIPDVIANSPVHMSGVWYDESEGQYYISDTIDYETGKYAQRVKTVTRMANSIGTFIITNNGYKYVTLNGLLSDALFNAGDRHSTWLMSQYFLKGRYWEGDSGEKIITIANSAIRLYFGADESLTSKDDVTTLMSQWDENGNSLKVSYILATPIEHDIPESEIVAYKALHSNYPTTTVFNDCDAMTEVGYVADTKNHIDQNYVSKADYNSLAERITALEARHT